MKPLFSILHTSARPNQWRNVYDQWMQMCEHPEQVEYVLCIDPRWGFSLDPKIYETGLDNVVVVKNTGRRCYVDGVNIAARAATGSIFVVNADDQFAPYGWDRNLYCRYMSSQGIICHDLTGADTISEKASFVIEVTTGTPQEHERGVLVMPILSRARYEAQGCNVFYPEYESMFADNDFCAAAKKDGVIIDARHLHFPHRHPMFDEQGGWRTDWEQRADDALRAQNRLEAYKLGAEVFKQRTAGGFNWAPTRTKRCIAFCYPGDDFRGPMVDSLQDLLAHFILVHDFEVLKLRTYTSNVYNTREEARRIIMNSGRKPDLVLWLDHDNPLTPAQFDQLLSDLDGSPDIDGVAGWCWIHSPDKTGFVPSCGEWSPDHLHWTPFPASFAREQQLRPLECGGFPCFLMRLSALEKAGDSPFLPVVDNRLEHGLLGEDFAFFLRAEKGGAKFLVDPKVRVPHLKYVEVNPVFESEGAPGPVKVACMIRAKNEARWIGRTIESVRALCGENIFVMEDGSTDYTFAMALDAGAKVIHSPFAGQGLNECRDKDWLLAHVERACSPDWILMPDGDEELEAGGCEKIRRALESNPPVDCFSLRFLHLWNSIDTFRSDGVYGCVGRQSLFRARSGLAFRSMYEGDGHNHVGLHCSNAPGLGQRMRVSPLNVFLLHYGNMHAADRVRKYKWILSIDPRNEAEDFYRHCVQGDLPEFPADAKLKHGGPLELQKLPARLVPKWDIEVPGPLVPDAVESFAAD